jgi:hypothetical protein
MARKITSLKARNIYKTRLFLGLVLKPLRLFCHVCDKYIPSDMEWICGHCNEQNHATRLYSFLNKCRNCKRPPKSFVCPHCGALNFLDKNKSGSHPASSITVPIPEKTKAEIRQLRHEERSDQKEDIEHEIYMTRLNAELAKARAAAKPREKKTRMEELKDDWERCKTDALGVDEIVHEALANNAAEFKNDPEKREKFDLFAKDWAEQHRTDIPFRPEQF